MSYASVSLFINKGSQDRNSSSRNLEAGADEDAEAMEECVAHTAFFLTACSAFFLVEPRTTNPGMVLPTSLVKKMPYRLACSPVF